ncbi:hypothetical protein [Streptomyces sp. KMM 9044]|uniref:hypothetical protein n=1 Tax=Streptomyces sp. KMM 9044 TaxID=2744474 RepID=UPI002150FB82|nr:hypothetical protein [Streptomyces sp. KMM 9044]WAX78997.1 hypothetical protein HUV60_016210 [Streptomyces sp. KMM 9044]
MRKTTVALAAIGAAVLGTVVPAGTAQASAACDNAWNSTPAGSMAAYEHSNCGGALLGRTPGDDSNWGNSQGAFQGSDTNRASSVLNAGTTDTAWKEVQFFNGTGTGWTGGYSCLARSEFYADNLTDDYFTSGYVINDAISSHRWVPASYCGRFMT